MTHMGYTEYDSIKVKLRIEDDSMKGEINLYMQEIDDLINNRVRAKLGEFNAYDEAIVLPLTFNTIPPITQELKGIANNLVVAKIRLQNSEKPLLWDSEVKILDNYLERTYGWTRDIPFQPERTLTVSPRSGVAGSTITLSGTNYKPVDELEIVFNSSNPTTTPTTVITDTAGVFSGVTFIVDSDLGEGSYEVKVVDSLDGLIVNFQVIL